MTPSSIGTLFSKNFEPKVVRIPAVGSRSLSEYGIPSSGPRSSPRLARSSLARASSQTTDQAPPTPPTSLYDVLRATVDHLQRTTRAEIVSLYPYDSHAPRFYAPVARGIAEDGLLASISDMHDQLARYRTDVA